MPYVSKAQAGWFHTHVKQLGASVVKKWDKASKGEHDLPEHVAHQKEADKRGIKPRQVHGGKNV